MPNVSFSLEYLKTLLPERLDEERILKYALEYGLEGEISGDHLNLEITAERPDLLAPQGFARVISKFAGYREDTDPRIDSSGMTLHADSSALAIRPHIESLVAENLRLNSNSLEELIRFQEKLTQTFGRDRRKVAIGMYDLAKIKGDVYFTSRGREEINFIPLNGDFSQTPEEIIQTHPMGKKYGHLLQSFEGVPVLIDSSGKILSMPLITNSNELGLITPETNRIFVDVMGTSEKAVNDTTNIIAYNLLDMGANVKSVSLNGPDISRSTPNLTRKKVHVELTEVNRILGQNYNAKEMSELLRKMDLRFSQDHVLVPVYRADILGPVDIAGDVVVAKGLDDLIKPSAIVRENIGRENELKSFCNSLSNISLRMGLSEVKSFILTNPDELNPFSGEYVKTTNSKSRLYSACRNSIQPGLMGILRNHAQSMARPLGLYEVGEVVIPDNGKEPYETINWAAAILDSSASFSTAKSVVQTILREYGISYRLKESNRNSYIRGRAAEIIAGDRVIGHFGEIYPGILNEFSISEPVCSAEFDCALMKKSQGNK